MKAYKFVEQVKQEVKKVTWPERKELLISSSVVVIAVFVVSLLCMALDYTIHGVISFLLKIGN